MMDGSAKIEDIRIETTLGRIEIRFDWDNDRHQAVEVLGSGPDAVQKALLDAAYILAAEKKSGHI